MKYSETPKLNVLNHATSLSAIAENHPNYADVNQNQFAEPASESRIIVNVLLSSNNQLAKSVLMFSHLVFAEKLLKFLHAKLVSNQKMPVDAKKLLFHHARSASNHNVFVLKKLKLLFLANHPNHGSAKNAHMKELAALAHQSNHANNAINAVSQFLSVSAKKLIYAVVATENHVTAAILAKNQSVSALQ